MNNNSQRSNFFMDAEERRFFETLGKNLQSARISEGFSQDELAGEAYSTRQTIWKYESGQSTSLAPLLLLTKKMEISLSEIIYGSLPISEKESLALQFLYLMPIFRKPCKWLLEDNLLAKQMRNSGKSITPSTWHPVFQDSEEFMFVNNSPELFTSLAFLFDNIDVSQSEDAFRNRIANNIAKIISKTETDPNDFADEIGVSPSTITNYISNGTMQLDKLFRMAAILNVPLFYFFEPNPNEYLDLIPAFKEFENDNRIRRVISDLIKVQDILIENLVKKEDNEDKNLYRVVLDLRSTKPGVHLDQNSILFKLKLQEYSLLTTLFTEDQLLTIKDFEF